ncbi:MAG TPA: T9SS type A sorting domain-containing protein, partial [Bacteroidia bacterium]|nr:T9SS type A sorting domain-containing protein [Bacteroidia bacterium]
SSCLPAGTSGLQISIFKGTYVGATLSLTKLNGGFCGEDITSTTTYTYPLAANDCNFIEVDGFAGTNCDYSLVAAISPTCVLPVQLLYFKSELTNQINVKLSWASSTEQNSDYYLIEKGTDMNNFVPLAEIKAKGTSSALTNYVAYDNNPNKGVNYYRLSSFDKNGERHMLGYTAVSNNAALSFFNLYPNPAKNSVTLSLKNFSTPALNYELYNGQGMLIDTQQIGLTNGDADYVMDISLLNKGFYFIKIINNDGVLTKTFLKSED